MKYLMLIGCLFSCCLAQLVVWPEQLAIPAQQNPEDSLRITIFQQQNLGMNFYSTDQIVNYYNSWDGKTVEQYGSYKYIRDHGLSILSHHVDFSGQYLSSSKSFPGISLGIEWIPQMVTSLDESFMPNRRTTSLGSLRIGPVFQVSKFILPLQLSGGPAIDLWKNSNSLSLASSVSTDYQKDKGYYGKVKFNFSEGRILNTIELYGQGEIVGCYMNQSKITAGNYNLVYAQPLPSHDTLLFFSADTLSIGRTAYFKQITNGSISYVTTNNRSHNAFQFLMGVKELGTFFPAPSFVYGLSMNTTQYQKIMDRLDDVHSIRNWFGTVMHSNQHPYISYKGGFSISHEYEDWVFTLKKLPSSAKNDSLLFKQIQANTRDVSVTGAKTSHEVQFTFPHYRSITMKVDMTSDKRRFPFFSIGPALDTSVRDDKDKLSYLTLVESNLFQNETVQLQVWGQYISAIGAFLRKEKSKDNMTNNIFEINMKTMWEPTPVFSISETIGALSKTSVYHFPVMHKSDFPPMSRKFFSRLQLSWAFWEKFVFQGYWNQIYLDNGSWISPEYIDTNKIPSSKKKFYAIMHKSLETNIEPSITFKINSRFSLATASFFQTFLNWEWNDTEKKYKNMSPDQIVLLWKPNFKMQASLLQWLQCTSFLQLNSIISIKKTSFRKERSFQVYYWEGGSRLSFNF